MNLSQLLVCAAGAAFLWWVVQLAFCLGYWRAMTGPRPAREPTGPWPTFIVFIPVRGFDTTLLTAIRSVLAVDYPAFRVSVLFDSVEDAAWQPVQEELARLGDPRIRMEVVATRRDNCSLLCSNLVAAIEALDETADLVAMCAADMIVPRSWLRSMALAMDDPEAGATLGNRWYLPPRATPGSLVRWMWNAGAVVLMRWCRIPWSGGMAVRVGELRRCGLLDRWATAMVEDVSVSSHFAAAPERLRFVPELIVPDREEIGLRSAFRFIARQLLWARLYSPLWPLVASSAVFGATMMFAAPAGAVVALGMGELGIAALALVGWGVYIGAMAVPLRLVETAVARAVGESWPSLSGLSRLAILAAIPLTQAIYFAAFCRAAFARTVDWRGLRYEIRGPWKIRRLNYAPFRARGEEVAAD